LSPFNENEPDLNPERLRLPQLEGYHAIQRYFGKPDAGREVAEVIPVGCGKSGLLAIAPFAIGATRALIVAPNLRIRSQLYRDVDVGNPNNFYHRIGVLRAAMAWESALIAGDDTNVGDIMGADVVVTNIQQLARAENRWLEQLPPDCFDLILFDEAHHNTAVSWERLRQKFPKAKIVSVTATPLRADGQRMLGELVYMYPVAAAMQAGYVKHVRALMLNPATLHYQESEAGATRQVTLDEVRELAKTDAIFRRAIVMSPESLASIVDASITKLRELRDRTGDNRHKIIASALNMTHCHQVVEAFRARGLRVDFVHSDRGDEENDRVLMRLDRHEIDAIVQVRMLGEGFDHPYLSVAAVCSVFGNLGPFVQFVGRVMRIVPGAVTNDAVVVFHAGSNIAPRWDDFREYSQVDQEFFSQLLPMDDWNFDAQLPSVELDPLRHAANGGIVQAQDRVLMQDIPLIDERLQSAIDTLADSGLDPEALAIEVELRRLHVPAQRQRQARRAQLDAEVKTRAARALHDRSMNPYGIGPNPPEKNLVAAIKGVNAAIARYLERRTGTRSDWSNDDYESIAESFDAIVAEAMGEVFDGR
jgi:superfamily II DNA or RNA helicase